MLGWFPVASTKPLIVDKIPYPTRWIACARNLHSEPSRNLPVGSQSLQTVARYSVINPESNRKLLCPDFDNDMRFIVLVGMNNNRHLFERCDHTWRALHVIVNHARLPLPSPTAATLPRGLRIFGVPFYRLGFPDTQSGDHSLTEGNPGAHTSTVPIDGLPHWRKHPNPFLLCQQAHGTNGNQKSNREVSHAPFVRTEHNLSATASQLSIDCRGSESRDAVVTRLCYDFAKVGEAEHVLSLLCCFASSSLPLRHPRALAKPAPVCPILQSPARRRLRKS